MKNNSSSKIMGPIAYLQGRYQNYWRNYRQGIEDFGVWWKVFHLSMWSIVFIFLFTAAIVFVFYVPQVELLISQL